MGDEQIPRVSLMQLGKCLHCDLIQIVNLHAAKGTNAGTALGMMCDVLALTVAHNSDPGAHQSNIETVVNKIKELFHIHMEDDPNDLRNMHVAGHG